MARRFYTTHNAIRGIAAIAVTLYHLQLEPNYRLPTGWATPLLRRGYLGVDLFFILSGFILSITYLDRLAGGRPAEIKAFLRARVARIFPLHLFVLALLAAMVVIARPQMAAIGGAPFWAFLDHPDPLHFAAQAALVQVWSNDATLSWNIPSWSISAEVHVYLLLPVIAVATRRWPRASLTTGAAIAALIYTYIMVRRWNLDILDPLSLARCLAGFLVGVTIRHAARRTDDLSRSVTAMLQLVATLTIGAFLLSPVHDVWMAPAFALLVFATANDRGPIGRLSAYPIFQAMERYSFAIYLLNFPVLLAADLAWPHVAPMLALWPDTLRRLAWSGAILVFLITMAAATFRWVETPTRDRMRSVNRIRWRQSVDPLDAPSG